MNRIASSILISIVTLVLDKAGIEGGAAQAYQHDLNSTCHVLGIAIIFAETIDLHEVRHQLVHPCMGVEWHLADELQANGWQRTRAEPPINAVVDKNLQRAIRKHRGS